MPRIPIRKASKELAKGQKKLTDEAWPATHIPKKPPKKPEEVKPRLSQAEKEAIEKEKLENHLKINPDAIEGRKVLDGIYSPRVIDALWTAESECWHRAGMREEWFVVDVLGRHRLYKTGTKKHIGETTFMGISPSIKIINGNISIHSHTKDRAFSYRDFQTNCMEAHCAEMRVISKHYRFTLRPPPWPPKELLKNFKHQERYGTPPTEECRYRWDVMRDLYEGRFKYFLREGLAKAKRKQLNKEIPEGEDAEWFYGSVYAWQEIANYYGATFTVEKIGPRYFRGAKKKEDLWKHQEKEDW